MFAIGFLTASYLVVALMAAMMTYLEQQQTGNRSVLLRTLGFLACAFWPVTVVTVAVAAQRSTG
jgi:hypothetical protein